jgi:LuxR family maltose regulon positive regulatory protein
MINLLETKLYIPTPRHNLLLRPHLIERLNEGNSSKLTLLSAPAGFGKSTLLSQWVSTITHPVSWLSLDANDNDPYRFLTYLISAIQKIDPNIGQEALEILHSSQNPPYEVILTLLINEISQISEHISLILDDYHFIDDEQIHIIISFIVDYMPRSMHLVVSTRLDPPLPLARMRVRHELVEIRSKDLRLTLEETAVLLNDVMGFALTMEDVKSLDERVEGWVASLHMAVLSMQETKDVSRFIKTFTGSNRFVLDYLMEEVLGKQTSEIKDFLLQTSIVERMNAPLCNAILDKGDSQQILVKLEQSNAFLIPLDNERIWYRYHHLFADLLQKRLMKIHPAQIQNLHIRASIWYDKEGLLTEAISHALEGKDLDRVANLVEKYGFAATSFNQEKTLSGWLELLPVDVVRNRPWLCILQAWLHYSFGPRAKAEEFLEMAEKLTIRTSSFYEMSPTPHFSSLVDQQHIKGAIASVRAHISITEGDYRAVLEYANYAFDNLTDEDPWRTTAMVALGLAYWALGDRHQSEKTFEYTSTAFLQRGNWDGVVSSLCYMGIMQFKHGNLHSALDTYTEALARATRPDGVKILFASIPSLRIGNLFREWNDLARAQDFIDSGIALAAKLNHPDVLIESYICLARLRYAFNDQMGVMKALNKADLILAKNQVDPWYLGWLDECWVSYWLSMENLPAAISQIERRVLTIDGPLSYQHDLHHTNLARVLIAQGVQDPSGPYLEQAEELLIRLQDAAEKADWVHETIKILNLKGLMFWASGEKNRSIDALTQSLTLGEPGGFVRMFIDEGAPMEEMLSCLLTQAGRGKGKESHIGVYAENLLITLKNGRKEFPLVESSELSKIVESLSDRELEVLHFLNTQLSSTEIAQELSISSNTVRFHIKNIYGKLSVNRRAAAVQRAKTLGIL